MAAHLPFETVLASMKAAGEETRLRILALLARSELTVSDLTAILGQSQPRISRHLKLLGEARLIDRHPEGAWVFYRLADEGEGGALARQLVDMVDVEQGLPAVDGERLAQIKAEQAEQASIYFAENAADWDRIRELHVADAAVEKAILEAVGDKRFESMLDLGTGTGRMLELLSPLYNRAIGVDASKDMLAIARANLDRGGHADAQVRLGDLRNLPFTRDSFDLVTVHQVLHYLDDPEVALAEAARVLRPGGRLLIVDFAPHHLEFLREDHAHRRLGFSQVAVQQWIEAAGLAPLEAVDLPSSAEGEGLTVTLWLARDPRMLIATDTASSLEVA